MLILLPEQLIYNDPKKFRSCVDDSLKIGRNFCRKKNCHCEIVCQVRSKICEVLCLLWLMWQFFSSMIDLSNGKLYKFVWQASLFV